jgi:serine/threonine protein kinase
MMAHVAVEPMPPSMRVPAVPEAMDHVVARALAKDPRERFTSAEEFAAALQPFVAAPPRPAPVAAGSDAAPAPPAPAAPIPPAGPAPTGPPDPNRWWTFYESTALLAPARFAKVYQGVHRLTGEHHAVKQLRAPHPAETTEDEQAARTAEAVRRLFLNEMHLLQSLAEEPAPVPGLVRMVQAYRGDARSPAYAMPLLAETLADHITRTGALPEHEALSVAREIGTALASLHQRGIVHRNLSPKSVLFTSEGRACLAGFDRACRLAERAALLAAEREVHVGSASPVDAMGDIRFVSPEQCRSEDFDPRTDIYSFGCVLWYLLTGWAPFERPDPLQVMLDHLSTPPPRLHDWGVPASFETQKVLDRALAKSPADRFAGLDEMLAALPR